MTRRAFNAGEIMRELNDEISEELGRIALRALSAVVLATPVGNPTLWSSPAPPGYVGGHARRNWHVSIGAKSDAELAGTDANGALTIAEGTSRINAWYNGEPVAPLHIQNAVPYIGRLDSGWSAQAPAGFVEKAVLAAVTSGRNNERREL